MVTTFMKIQAQQYSNYNQESLKVRYAGTISLYYNIMIQIISRSKTVRSLCDILILANGLVSTSLNIQ